MRVCVCMRACVPACNCACVCVCVCVRALFRLQLDIPVLDPTALGNTTICTLLLANMQVCWRVSWYLDIFIYLIVFWNVCMYAYINTNKQTMYVVCVCMYVLHAYLFVFGMFVCMYVHARTDIYVNVHSRIPIHAHTCHTNTERLFLFLSLSFSLSLSLCPSFPRARALSLSLFSSNTGNGSIRCYGYYWNSQSCWTMYQGRARHLLLRCGKKLYRVCLPVYIYTYNMYIYTDNVPKTCSSSCFCSIIWSFLPVLVRVHVYVWYVYILTM